MAIDDLDWWFQWRAGDLGLHGIRYDAAPSSGRAVDDTGYQDHHMTAAGRARRVSDVLERLTHHAQRVLRAFYTPLLPAVRAQLVGAFGDLAGVVLLLEGPERTYEIARDREWLGRRYELRTSAQAALDAAEAAYRYASGLRRYEKQSARTSRLEELRARLRGAA